MLRFSFFALSIVSLLAPVNGEAADAHAANTPSPTLSDKLKKKSGGLSLEGLVQRLLGQGKDEPLGKNIGAALGFAAGAPTKTLSVEPPHAADNRARDCMVVLEETPQPGEPKPICLLFLSKKYDSASSDSYWFRLWLDGTLERAFLARIRLDESGKVIRGSGVKTDLDVNDPETKALLQRELDFWLKGKYRHKTAAAPAAAAPVAAAAR